MDKVIAQRLLGLLRQWQPQMVSTLQQWAGIESPSSDRSAQQPMFDAITAELCDLGFVCQRLPGTTSGGQLLGRRNDSSEPQRQQLVLGHCDTVWDHGTLNRMPIESKHGRLSGPGVFDMKGGLVQVVYAFKALRHLQVELAVSPVIFINSDEEIGSKDSMRQIEELAKSMIRVLVVEPALGEAGCLKTSRKGVGRYRITAIGRSAHAGLDPEKGISAIHEIGNVVTRLAQLNDPQQGITVNVGRIEGGTRPNVVAAEASIEVDVRVTTSADADRLQTIITSLKPSIAGARLNIITEPARPPLEPTAANRRLWQSAQTAADQLDLAICEAAAGGGSDGNFTSQFTATLDGLGAVGGGAHAVDEHVIEDKLPERAALLALLLASE